MPARGPVQPHRKWGPRHRRQRVASRAWHASCDAWALQPPRRQRRAWAHGVCAWALRARHPLRPQGQLPRQQQARPSQPMRAQASKRPWGPQEPMPAPAQASRPGPTQPVQRERFAPSLFRFLAVDQTQCLLNFLFKPCDHMLPAYTFRAAKQSSSVQKRRTSLICIEMIALYTQR